MLYNIYNHNSAAFCHAYQGERITTRHNSVLKSNTWEMIYNKNKAFHQNRGTLRSSPFFVMIAWSLNCYLSIDRIQLLSKFDIFYLYTNSLFTHSPHPNGNYLFSWQSGLLSMAPGIITRLTFSQRLRDETVESSFSTYVLNIRFLDQVVSCVQEAGGQLQGKANAATSGPKLLSMLRTPLTMPPPISWIFMIVLWPKITYSDHHFFTHALVIGSLPITLFLVILSHWLKA